MSQPLANGMILQVRVCCVLGSQIMLNVLHYRVSGLSGTPQTDAQAATYFNTTLAPSYKAWIATAVTYRGVGVKIIKPNPFIEVADVSLAGVGSGTNPPLPSQVSGKISFYTQTPGRHGRGRIYPGFPGAYITGTSEAMSATGQTNLAAIRTAIPNNPQLGSIPNVTSLQHCVYDKKTGGTIDITSYVTDFKWCTQRRRGDEGRANTQPF